eukprot:TRINITY_DN1219_c0_g1_i7.p1 TRINITY_DN1219_c0_g1~~TRINITY_DN1219_c0_g1_i7.p1  ORF type:complete len:714 (+),score=232.78 TRINITY_DN1219_c0_g1_i7:63-2204(+)
MMGDGKAATRTTALAALLATAAADIYASAQYGSDAHDGTSPATAVKTFKQATVQALKLNDTSLRLKGRFFAAEDGRYNLWPGQVPEGLAIDKWENETEKPLLTGGVQVVMNTSAGVWVSAAPLASAALAALNNSGNGAIFVNGARRELVRTAMLRWNATLVPGSQKRLPQNKRGFVYSEGDIPASWDISPAALSRWRVAAFHSWVKGYHRVASLHPENRTIFFSEDALFSYGDFTYCSDRRYYIEAAAELPVTAGTFTWKGNQLLYSPTPAEAAHVASGGALEVFVPVMTTVMYIGAVGRVALRNLAFAHSAVDCMGTACDADIAAMAQPALQLQMSVNTTVANCTFSHLEGNAINVVKSIGARLTNLVVEDVGAGGVFIQYSPHAVATNSWVAGYGRRHPAGIGVSQGQSPYSEVSHNDVTDGFFNGLGGNGANDGSAYSTWKYNIVHGTGKGDEMAICDYGGLHFSTTNCSKPVHITYNVLRDVTAYMNGGEGLYLDVSSTAVHVEGNFVANVTGAPLHWNVNPMVPQLATAPRMNFTNNVFIASPRPESAYYLPKDKKGAVAWSGYTDASFTRNVVITDAGAYTGGLQPSWFEGIPCAKEEVPTATCTSVFLDNFKGDWFADNVYFNTTNTTSGAALPPSATFPGGCAHPWLESCNSFAAWQGLGYDKGSLMGVDPMLDAGYNVKNPAALALGIVPLGAELKKVGPNWTP